MYRAVVYTRACVLIDPEIICTGLSFLNNIAQAAYMIIAEKMMTQRKECVITPANHSSAPPLPHACLQVNKILPHHSAFETYSWALRDLSLKTQQCRTATR